MVSWFRVSLYRLRIYYCLIEVVYRMGEGQCQCLTSHIPHRTSLVCSVIILCRPPV